jgi:hypothetical protein
MVGTSTNDPDPDSVLLIPSSKAVYNIDTISGVEVVDGTFTVDSPNLTTNTLATLIQLLINGRIKGVSTWSLASIAEGKRPSRDDIRSPRYATPHISMHIFEHCRAIQ